MAIGARILSNNLSGKTTNVTFEPISGGTFNLGTKIVPFNNIDSYPYGIYNLYFAEYDYTYSLFVPDPTPLELTLNVEYFSGSIISKYTLISNRYVSNPVTIFVDNTLEVFTGSPINIVTGVTIPYGNISGQTIVTVDGDYDNTTGVYLFGQPILSGAPSGSTAEIIVINPKPTQLVDPIITDNDEYVSVGDDIYLQFVDPPEGLYSSLNFGRRYIKDDRDNNFLISNFYDYIYGIKQTNSTPRRQITSRNWNDEIWWGNQGSTSQCVGFAWSHWISDGPITHNGTQPVVSPELIYREAQKLDIWPGENYDGTSVRAGAKYLKNINKIISYYWAFDLNTLVNTVLNLGPVVVGTNWYNGMFRPIRGVIRPTGRLAGGHAYVINGVNTTTRMFRIKNSWGRNWGLQGRAFISFNDMSRLIRENGEICLAIENNS